jgi:hypothetical protein
MPQVTGAATEVVRLGTGLGGEEVCVALERRPATAAPAGAGAVRVLQLQRLTVQKVCQAHGREMPPPTNRPHVR